MELALVVGCGGVVWRSWLSSRTKVGECLWITCGLDGGGVG